MCQRTVKPLEHGEEVSQETRSKMRKGLRAGPVAHSCNPSKLRTDLGRIDTVCSRGMEVLSICKVLAVRHEDLSIHSACDSSSG